MHSTDITSEITTQARNDPDVHLYIAIFTPAGVLITLLCVALLTHYAIRHRRMQVEPTMDEVPVPPNQDDEQHDLPQPINPDQSQDPIEPANPSPIQPRAERPPRPPPIRFPQPANPQPRPPPLSNRMLQPAYPPPRPPALPTRMSQPADPPPRPPPLINKPQPADPHPVQRRQITPLIDLPTSPSDNPGETRDSTDTATQRAQEDATDRDPEWSNISLDSPTHDSSPIRSLTHTPSFLNIDESTPASDMPTLSSVHTRDTSSGLSDPPPLDSAIMQEISEDEAENTVFDQRLHRSGKRYG